ncbi:MAG: radical SAM/SPASM domain-containing protein [Candidatus Sumerlaeia bacterium]|nr:radical SAM/SPASM domain-containing protein [Candidatus Sumerlaeia bacterium]
MSDARLVPHLGKALRRTAQAHLRDWLGAPPRPLKLRMALTNRCNSRCIMCSIWKFQDNFAPSIPGETSPDDIRRLGERSRDFFSELNHISLTGGEATLRRDLVELLRAVGEAFPGRSVSLNTNGFSPAKLHRILDEACEFLHGITVTISLDGIGATHGVVRGMGSKVYDAVRESIDGIVARREAGRPMDVEVNTVMTNANADQMAPVHAFCAERKIAWNPIFVIKGQLYQNQSGQDDALVLSPDSRRRLTDDMRAIAKARPSVKNSETLRLLEEDGRRDYDCWAGRLLLLIEENGDVYPNGGCPPEFKIGNMRDTDFDLGALFATPLAREVLAKAKDCRACAIPCEYMTTLRYAEALEGWRKTRRAAELAGA